MGFITVDYWSVSEKTFDTLSAMNEWLIENIGVDPINIHYTPFQPSYQPGFPPDNQAGWRGSPASFKLFYKVKRTEQKRVNYMRRNL